jgi:glutaredoxin 3
MNKTDKVFLTIGGLGLIYWTFDHLNKQGSLSKTDIILYDLEHCPYCQKVRAKLEELDLPYKRKSVEIAKNKKELAKKRDGVTTVPYIEIDGEGTGESDIIVMILENMCGKSK